LGQPLNTAVELALAVIGGLRHLQCTAEIGYGLTVGRQLLNGFEPENNLQGCVADSLHGGVPGPVWPDEDSHSPWTNSKAPRHLSVALLHQSKKQGLLAKAYAT